MDAFVLAETEVPSLIWEFDKKILGFRVTQISDFCGYVICSHEKINLMTFQNPKIYILVLSKLANRLILYVLFLFVNAINAI